MALCDSLRIELVKTSIYVWLQGAMFYDVIDKLHKTFAKTRIQSCSSRSTKGLEMRSLRNANRTIGIRWSTSIAKSLWGEDEREADRGQCNEPSGAEQRGVEQSGGLETFVETSKPDAQRGSKFVSVRNRYRFSAR